MEQLRRCLKLLFLGAVLCLIPAEGWAVGEENPDCPRAITLRTRVVQNQIVDNAAKVQLVVHGTPLDPVWVYDGRDVKNGGLVDFYQGGPYPPLRSVSFVYEGNGFFETDDRDRVIYGTRCGNGDLLFPQKGVVYEKPFSFCKSSTFIQESLHENEEKRRCISVSISPFGIQRQGVGTRWYYYPYGGFLEKETDIKSAEQYYFETLQRRRATGLTVGYRGIFSESPYPITREQGISAGAALCEGYARIEFIQPASAGVIRQVYKSFRYTHPGKNFNLVDIVFVQDLRRSYFQRYDVLPPQIGPPAVLENETLLAKIQAMLPTERLQEAFPEETLDNKQAALALSPFWEEIQNSLVVTAQFMEAHPLLADVTLHGLQLVLGGPLKFALTKVAGYFAGDLIESTKEKTQRFLVEQFNVSPDHLELATAALGMGVDLVLSQPASVAKSAKKVVEAAKNKATKGKNSLNALDLAGGKKGVNPLKPTQHSVHRKIEREIKSVDELDAFKNPLKIGDVKVDSLGRESQRYVGKNVEIVVNPHDNKIISVNPTSSIKRDKLLEKIDEGLKK